MDVRFCCPTCDHHLVIDQAAVGLVVKCPQCGQHVIVPDPVETKPAAGQTTESHPESPSEKTVALKWVPPPTSNPRVEPKP